MPGLKAPSMSAAVVGFGAMFMLMMATLFSINVRIKAGYKDTLDPAYPYLQAVAMHRVKGKPFLYYLSHSLKSGEIVEGINVTGELEKFGESFELIDSSGKTILSADSGKPQGRKVKKAYLAVPRGGYLVMTYG